MIDTIVTGDARLLADAIPDRSVDFIFTDPVYQQVEDYTWLAEQAQRVLRPRGCMLAWCSVPRAGRCQQAMTDAGMEYVYTLHYVVQAKTSRMRWYNLFCWTTPCHWFQLPGMASKPRRWIPDTYMDTLILGAEKSEDIEVRAATASTVVSTAGPSGSYVWNKNLGVLLQYVNVFSAPGDTVWDPFTGEGSVPIACKMLGRHFIASEIDKGVAKKARHRLDVTQVPFDTQVALQQQAMEGL